MTVTPITPSVATSPAPSAFDLGDVSWKDVCAIDEILANRGVCALVGTRQVALFKVSPGDEVFALSNYDPFSKAFVLSRGIVGSRGDRLKVASPLYKHAFDLRTGEALDSPDTVLPTFPVRVVEGRVKVGLLPSP